MIPFPNEIAVGLKITEKKPQQNGVAAATSITRIRFQSRQDFRQGIPFENQKSPNKKQSKESEIVSSHGQNPFPLRRCCVYAKGWTAKRLKKENCDLFVKEKGGDMIGERAREEWTYQHLRE